MPSLLKIFLDQKRDGGRLLIILRKLWSKLLKKQNHRVFLFPLAPYIPANIPSRMVLLLFSAWTMPTLSFIFSSNLIS
jgi:hypothetical protein